MLRRCYVKWPIVQFVMACISELARPFHFVRTLAAVLITIVGSVVAPSAAAQNNPPPPSATEAAPPQGTADARPLARWVDAQALTVRPVECRVGQAGHLPRVGERGEGYVLRSRGRFEAFEHIGERHAELRQRAAEEDALLASLTTHPVAREDVRRARRAHLIRINAASARLHNLTVPTSRTTGRADGLCRRARLLEQPQQPA